MERQAAKLAKGIDKEDFLDQLREAWRPLIKQGSDIELETKKAMERIASSGKFKVAFDAVDITEDDIRVIVKEILDSKPAQLVYSQPKAGRNELCPCGSGKKYKRCCGA